MIATDEQVARSIATAALLILSGKDPAEDFASYAELPTENGRPIASFRGQNLPMTFGPSGSFLAPSVMVEFGVAGSERGVIDRPMILSISRLAQENSIERELMSIGAHAALLRPFVYGTAEQPMGKSPVYQFELDTGLPTGIVGLVVWAAAALRHLPKPFDRTLLGIDAGGWIKKEFHFTAHYQLAA